MNTYTINEETGIITDSNGNTATIAVWGSRELAEESLQSLRDCKFCNDCEFCKECTCCSKCTLCDRCTYCINCNFSDGSSECVHSTHLSDCHDTYGSFCNGLGGANDRHFKNGAAD